MAVSGTSFVTQPLTLRHSPAAHGGKQWLVGYD